MLLYFIYKKWITKIRQKKTNKVLKNIGSYILLFTLLLLMISSLLFIKCGLNLLEDDINEIIELKKGKIKDEEINIRENIDKNDKKNNRNKKKK